MSAGTAALAGRAAAELNMQDTLTAYSPNGTAVVNGFEVPAYTTVGTTPGKFAGPSQNSDTTTQTVTIGGMERPVVKGGLHIPISSNAQNQPKSGEYHEGWEYAATAIGPETPAQLSGTRWLVVGGTIPKSDQTALRLDVVRLV